jgi:hypothetical protein
MRGESEKSTKKKGCQRISSGNVLPRNPHSTLAPLGEGIRLFSFFDLPRRFFGDTDAIAEADAAAAVCVRQLSTARTHNVNPQIVPMA